LIFLWLLSFYQEKESDNPPNKKLPISNFFWKYFQEEKYHLEMCRVIGFGLKKVF